MWKILKVTSNYYNECNYCHKRHSGKYRRKSYVCFSCEKFDHRLKDCPTAKLLAIKSAERKVNVENFKGKVNLRVYSMTQQEVDRGNDAVISIILVNFIST
ncbi:hypothetical protein ACH5RR_018835 [Cinchona calisaya]|uniref:CCHC-type domain-containing protein n=1 Tax=Cinchona calisaya TaxID=153742 RepID=A0ABD2ZML5_9GENT